MNIKLPRIAATDAIKVLGKIGFFLVRKSGSHEIYKNKRGKRITIPYHRKKVLHPKILKSILIDSGLSIDEFNKLLK
ncbi:MAG: type II toxin-antitoxin system HicA family toxin [Elusimicrobia bacterium]|nr:type II toxin-antitoxin system HicA family toxin [Elusimicrobiota bacterium]OGD36571.1 MAG: hypothetical protein A2V94_09450 [Candidatus Atribacteria bacterium RBG_16_35_8]